MRFSTYVGGKRTKQESKPAKGNTMEKKHSKKEKKPASFQDELFSHFTDMDVALEYLNDMRGLFEQLGLDKMRTKTSSIMQRVQNSCDTLREAWAVEQASIISSNDILLGGSTIKMKGKYKIRESKKPG